MSQLTSRRRRGFTLIEVLLVLVILVLLASMSVPLYQRYQRQANEKAAKSQIGMLETGIEGYQVNVGTYPDALDGLVACPAGLANPNRWEGPYMKSLPLDPWDRQYQYKYPGDHNPQSYDLWTVTPDGRQIGNWPDQ